MNCHELDRWLDEGGAAAGRATAQGHARTCDRCATALRAADGLGAALALASYRAPADLADRVMARVAVTPQVRARVPLVDMLASVPALPWWVRASFEPATVFATLLASLLLWRGDALFALASRAAAVLVAWLAALAPAGPSDAVATIWLQPVMLTSLVLGAAPLVLMSSQVLYRWSAGLVGPRHLRARTH